MPNKWNNTLEYNHGEKSLKVPFIIYFDLESLLPKMHSCQSNPEKSYTERKTKHEPSGYSWSLVFLFDATRNKHDFYRERDRIENFCKDLKELAMEIINYEEKNLIPLTDKEKKKWKSRRVLLWWKWEK